MTNQDFDIKDPGLAAAGRNQIDWAEGQMPVLAQIRRRFAHERPLAGVRLSACLHVTAKTAALARTLAAGGADLALCASNPLSTQDAIAASLVVNDEIAVFAICGEDNDTYYRHIGAALDHRPHVLIDDGADLVTTIVRQRPELGRGLLGSTEETTTGVKRLQSMAADGLLAFPTIAVNDSRTKHMFDNRYGTGQSALDGVIRATNVLLAGKTMVVAGYGWCGRGIAARARGFGAHVVITEIDPVRALEAAMDGFRVLPMEQAAAEADLIMTVTGDVHIVDAPHIALLKDGVILANSGHFNVEVNIPAIERLAVETRRPRTHITQYILGDGRRINLLGEGRLINLVAGEGHPPGVMDLSFANQALAAEYILRAGKSLAPGVHMLPETIDQEIAALKLAAMGIEIDTLSAEQQRYLGSWQEGT